MKDYTTQIKRIVGQNKQWLKWNNETTITDLNNQANEVNADLNPETGSHYIVERNCRLGLSARYTYLIKISGLDFVHANLVRANDSFKFPQSPDQPPIHEYDVFSDNKERGDIRGGYVTAKLNANTWFTITLTLKELLHIKSKAKGTHSDFSPWKQFELDMFKKVLIKKLLKYVGKANDIPNDDEYEFTPISAPEVIEHEKPIYDLERAKQHSIGWRNSFTCRQDADTLVKKISDKFQIEEHTLDFIYSCVPKQTIIEQKPVMEVKPKAKLPPYPEALFEDAWNEWVKSGEVKSEKDANNLIETISKNYSLTGEQIKQIHFIWTNTDDIDKGCL